MWIFQSYPQDPKNLQGNIDRATYQMLETAFSSDDARKLINNCILPKEGGAKVRAKTCELTDLDGKTINSLGKFHPHICYWLKFAQNKISTEKNPRQQNLLLLYGPPGNGKTTIAKKIAFYSGRKFIELSGSSIVNKYVGSGQQSIKAAFNEADLYLKLFPNAPGIIIFIDEIDQIAANNNQESRAEHKTATTELWQLLDKSAQNPKILFIAATNHYEKLNPTFLDRFKEINIVFIDNPDENERKYHFKEAFNEIGITIDETCEQFKKLITMTQKLSIRQLYGIASSVRAIADMEYKGVVYWETIFDVTESTIANHNKAIINQQLEEFNKKVDEYQKRLALFHQFHQALLIEYINLAIKKNGQPLTTSEQTSIISTVSSVLGTTISGATFIGKLYGLPL